MTNAADVARDSQHNKGRSSMLRRAIEWGETPATIGAMAVGFGIFGIIARTPWLFGFAFAGTLYFTYRFINALLTELRKKSS